MSDTPQKATDQEARFFLAIIRHQKNKPEIDWEAVAADAGYSNGNTAQTRFGQIKRKLNMATGNTPAKATPAKKGGVSKASSSKSSGKGAGKGTGKGKGKGKAAQLLDEEPERDDDEPNDSKIPLNFERAKVKDEIKEETPSATVKNE